MFASRLRSTICCLLAVALVGSGFGAPLCGQTGPAATPEPATTQVPTSPAQSEAAFAGEAPLVTPTYEINPKERRVWDPDHVADFSLVDQTGQTVTLADLKGRPWVASFIFTRCIHQCPMMCRGIRELIDELNHGRTEPHPVRFVTITIDPAHDTLQLIREFGDNFGAKPDQWLFLTGEKEAIYELIRHGFKVSAWEQFEAGAGMEFAHDMHLLHIDESGKILGRYESLDKVELTTLRRVLEGKIETPLRHQPARIEEQQAIAAHEAAVLAADPLAKLPAWAKRLPATNAGLNGLATLLLINGFLSIKAKRPRLHKLLMLYAFGASVLFLGCYLTYHWALHTYTGEHGKKFIGDPGITRVYFAILISHVLLAMAVPVLASMTIWKGLGEQWESHRRWAKVTFPIWLYVSITGVVIYWMLYHVSR